VTAVAPTRQIQLMSRVLLVALAVFAAGLLSHPPVADAQSRYDVSRMGDVVTLSDTRTALVVRVLTPASNAYEMTVKGEDVIRRTWNTLDDIRGQLGLNGVPLLWPSRIAWTSRRFTRTDRNIHSILVWATPAAERFPSMVL